MAECHGFVPYMQLCVCYDRMGCHEQAFFFHKKAEEEKPNDPKVKYNAMGCHEQAFFFHKKASKEKPDDPGVKCNTNYFSEQYGLE